MMLEHAVDEVVNDEYQYGFVTDIESDVLPPGLDESVIRAISARKRKCRVGFALLPSSTKTA